REKSALAGRLADAILTIEALDPDFGTAMKTKYVNKALQAIVRPTAAERMFVEDSSVLRVGFLPDFAPFFTIRNNLENSEGLYVDFLKLLSNVSGLRFSVRQVASVDELAGKMESGEIDLAFATYVNGFSPPMMHFSGNFRNEAYSVVRRRDGKAENFAKGAAVLPVGFPGVDNYFGNKYKKRVRMMATVEQCLDAVASGAYEEAYIPTMYLRRENSLFLRSDLEATKETAVPVVLAASPRQPKILQDVLDTALLRMNRAEVERLAQENAMPHLSVKYLLYRYPTQTAMFFCFLLAGGVAMAFVLYRSRLQKQQNKVLQKKNKDLEIALANVEAMRIARDGYKAESETDKLTSVYNKAGFERIVREALSAPQEGKGAAIYIIDLDHFKEANDTYGHQCGDAILQNFAKALKCVFRKSDCVGRFGGDEFTVFIEETLTREVVARKAAQIVEAARSVAIEGIDIKVTGSVGAAIFPEHGTSYDDLFKAADDALYKVKSGGRNGYSIASGEIER
ncbi:MAG: GGDEF domain-containing protein, partial [Schwartzia sp.]|nr:GGDEF domain-containing protein [Schwartzia sp. (in: firmicutes)]